MTSNAVTTWAGTSFGSTTNVDRLACEFNLPYDVAYMAPILYVADCNNARIVRVSFVSKSASVLSSGLSYIFAVEAYRGKVFFARGGHRFLVIDVYSGKWIVFLGLAKSIFLLGTV